MPKKCNHYKNVICLIMETKVFFKANPQCISMCLCPKIAIH